MENSAPIGGDSPRLPDAQRWRPGTRDGQPVVIIEVTKSERPVWATPLIFDYYVALGYRPTTCNKGDGDGRVYPAHHATTPGITTGYPRDLARTFLAIWLVYQEKVLGFPAENLDGRHVVALNGDKFDLRIENLDSRPGKIRDGGWRTIADVRKRWAIRFPSDGSPGRDPNAVFAAERRAARATKRTAKREDRGGGHRQEAPKSHA
jgi:hypothetical protein